MKSTQNNFRYRELRRNSLKIFHMLKNYDKILVDKKTNNIKPIQKVQPGV